MYNILFVEDDETISYLMSRMEIWNEIDFQIRAIACNGKEALILLEKDTAFDLVITDIRMPIVDGLELIRIMRQRNIEIPVLLASTYSDFQYVREGLRLGALDYLVKPYTNINIKETLEIARETLDKLQVSETREDYIPEICREKFRALSENSREDFLDLRIMKYTSLHVCENGFIENLEMEMGLSRDYMSKLFKKENGLTLNEYIIQTKIEYAKNDLLHTTMKIYEISEKLGYSSIDYFTKIFRNHTGSTPLQYRKKGRKSNFPV